MHKAYRVTVSGSPCRLTIFAPQIQSRKPAPRRFAPRSPRLRRCAAPVRPVSDKAPSTSGKFQRPSPLNTTHRGWHQAASPGELLWRLPWCGAINTSQGRGSSASTSPRPGASRSPGSRIRRPRYSTDSTRLLALSEPRMPPRRVEHFQQAAVATPQPVAGADFAEGHSTPIDGRS